MMQLAGLCLLCVVQMTVAHYNYKTFLPMPTKPMFGRYAGMSMEEDPRLDRRSAQKFLDLGMGGIAPPNPVFKSYEEAQEWGKAANEGYGTLLGALLDKNRPRYNPPQRTVEIDGVDKNKIGLDIYQGNSKTCYYYTHGGGMAILSGRSVLAKSTMRTMAARHGMTTVSVEFRNFLAHPDPKIEAKQFPAGLNDCYSGLVWLYDHKKELGCETIVNYGESGGGNLCLALSLKTVKEGRPELLDGSFCHCPEASNDAFSERTPSMTENAGYWIDGASEGFQKTFMDMYTADPADRTNPLAWPIHAGPKDMKGMKPVMIIVNELDPLRDAGLEMYRNLLAGGVDTEARMVMGSVHAGDIGPMAGGIDNRIWISTINAMKSFAARLRGKILVEADPMHYGWVQLGSKVICDLTSEKYLQGSSGKVLNLERCKQSCVRAKECQSVTYFKSGFCSHFSTACSKTRKSDKAQASLRLDRKTQK